MLINHIDERKLEALISIKDRLFAPKPLTPDERRDLANWLQVIIDSIETTVLT